MSEVIGLVGGLAQTAGSIYSANQASKVADRAEAEREAEYQDLKKKTDPSTMLANINKLVQPMTARQKQDIIQTIAGSRASSGQAGAEGIIEEAVAEALSKGEEERFTDAEKAYLQSIGIPLSALRAQPAAGKQAPNVKGVFDALAGLVKPAKAQTAPPLPIAQGPGTSFQDYYQFQPEVQSVVPPDLAVNAVEEAPASGPDMTAFM